MNGAHTVITTYMYVRMYAFMYCVYLLSILYRNFNLEPGNPVNIAMYYLLTIVQRMYYYISISILIILTYWK